MKPKRETKVSALRVGTIWLILLAVLAVLAVVAINVGSAKYSVRQIINAVFSDEKSTAKIIVMNLRMPRLLLACMIGASLSSSGAILQSVMRNPLADPGTIGVSAGAGTAATTILLLFPQLTGSVPLFAFGGAALACFLIYSMAWKGGVDPVRIILSGVAVNSVLGAYNALLQMMHTDSLEGVLAFMNGSLSGRNWTHVRVCLIYSGIGLVLSFLCIKGANILQLGDEMAKSLGINVSRTRILLSAVSAFLAAATVSVAGMIGFVGLVIRQEALPVAQLLEKQFGIPYVFGAPYGYQKTSEWLDVIAEKLGRVPNPKVIGPLKKSATEMMQYRMYARMLRRDKMQAYLYGEYETVRGIGEFLSEMGIRPTYQISAHNTAPLSDVAEGILYLPGEKERISILKNLDHTLVLADDTAKRLISGTNTFLRIATPLIDGSQVAHHMPLIGPRGADMIREAVDEYVNTLR